MPRSFAAAAGAVVLLLFPLVANAQVCPTTLTPGLNWFETSPPFFGISELRMVLTLRNEETVDFLFVAGDTFQMWGVPTGDPPVVVNAEPVGVVTPGATFTYDLTFDLSGVPTATALAFRPYDSFAFGILDPTQASLVSVELTCGAPAVVPDLGRWGLVVLVTAIVAAAVWRLRNG
jgi:hypothetical protein